MTAAELKAYISSQLTVPLNLVSKLINALFAMVDFTTSSVTTIIPDWTNAITFNTIGPNIYCTYLDTDGNKKLWQTKTDGNTGNQPPTAPATHEDTYWLEVSASASAAIPEWAPGLYGPGLIIVYHNHSVNGSGLYLLLEPTRPFNSANIETELTALKWELISGGGGAGTVVSVTGDGVDNTDSANPVLSFPTLTEALTKGNNAGGLQIINLANPSSAQHADTQGARDSAVAAAVAALKASVPVAGDNLNKLYNLIVDLGALVGGWNTSSLPTTGSGASSAIDKGDYWRITGTITISGIGDLKAGDMLIASVANASVAADFFAVQNNVDLATASVQGIVKLAQDLLASATDAAVSQAAMVTAMALKENTANKDASGGYAGLTLFKINFKNALNTITSFFTNANTVARTYTFQDRNGTIADDTDLALKSPLASPTFTGTVTTPAIIVSSETASRVAIIDASKNVKSADTTTYPSLTEFSYVKGVASPLQAQIDFIKNLQQIGGMGLM